MNSKDLHEALRTAIHILLLSAYPVRFALICVNFMPSYAIFVLVVLFL